MPRKGRFRVTKTQIVGLLDKQAGLRTADFNCAAESAAVLQCWAEVAVSPSGELSGGCEQHEVALKRCEMRMNNVPVAKAKMDIRRSLIFHMLRMANNRHVKK